MADHYQLLGLSPDAGTGEIQEVCAALRSRLERYAPGITFTDEDLAKLYPERWNAIRELLNPEIRRTYDAMLQQRAASPVPETEAAVPAEPPSRLSVFLSYAAFIGLLSAGVLFLLLLAGYML